MNHCVPDFETEEDYLIPASSSLSSRMKKSSAMGGDEDIMELLWQNGQVVVQSQNQRSVNNKRFSHIGENAAEVKLIRSNEEPTPSNLFMQEDEMASWLHYPIDDSSLDRYLYTDLLYHPATSAAVSAASPSLPTPSTVTVPPRPPTPPLRRLEAPESQPKYQNFMHFSRPSVATARNVISSSSAPSSSKTTTAARQSTVVDSNETPTPTPAMAVGPESRTSRVADSTAQVSGGNIGTVNAVVGTSSAGREPETAELSVTSSPGTGSGASANADPSSQKPLPTVTEDRKRKGREGDDTDCHSEDVEFEYAETKKQARGSTSAKRSRAAEVHNLSERRRRDRINEKMKALQELIPRCNKSDKASMLDEAIEYLKSLHLQVQMMSMGCSMVPMMFPGVQQYMPPMAMGMGMGMGMNMDMGMNRAMVPYPSVLPGPGMSSSPSAAAAAAAAHMGPRFPVPAFHMPQVPATAGASRSQAPNHPDVTLGSFVPQNHNQPRMPSFPDPYQQFLSLQQTHLALPQNQAMLQPGSSKASSSKDVRNPEHPHQAG